MVTSGAPSTSIKPATAWSPGLTTFTFLASLSLSLSWMSEKTRDDLEMFAWPLLVINLDAFNKDMTGFNAKLMEALNDA